MTINDVQNPVYQMIDKIWAHIQRSLLQGTFEYEPAVAALTQHLEVARDLKHPLLEGRIYSWLALIELELDHFEAAQGYYQQALKIFEEIGDQNRVAAMINNLGETYRRSNRHVEAAECFVRTQAVGQALGDMRMEILATTNEGLSRLALGELERAEILFKQAIGLGWISSNDDYIRSAVGESHDGLAQIFMAQGQYEAAQEEIDEALLVHRERLHVHHMASTYLTMARLAAANPTEGKDPVEYFRLSRDFAQKSQSPARIVHVLLAEADYWDTHNSPDRALACYQETAQLIEHHQLPEDLKFVRQRIHELSQN